MHTGKGSLILEDGRELLLNFQFGSDLDEVRSGYLYFDTSVLDPASYGDRMDLVCEDGTAVQFVVVHFSDRYLAISGRRTCRAA